MNHQDRLGSYISLSPLPGAHRAMMGRHMDSGQEVVLKHFPLERNEIERRSLRRVLMIPPGNSQNVCVIEEIGLDEEGAYAAAPYVEGANLRRVLRTLARHPALCRTELHVSAVCVLMADLAVGVDNRARHQGEDSLSDVEIEPCDLLVDAKGQGIVLDARWSLLRLLSTGPAKSIEGALAYALPARFRHRGGTEVQAVWVLAVLTWELLAGYRLFRRREMMNTLRALDECVIPEVDLINPAVSRAMASALSRILAAPDRLTLSQFAAALRVAFGLTAQTGQNAVARWYAELFKDEQDEGVPSSGTLQALLDEENPTWSYLEEATYSEGPPQLSGTALSPFELEPAESALRTESAPPLTGTVPPEEPQEHESVLRLRVASVLLILGSLSVASIWSSATPNEATGELPVASSAAAARAPLSEQNPSVGERTIQLEEVVFASGEAGHIPEEEYLSIELDDLPEEQEIGRPPALPQNSATPLHSPKKKALAATSKVPEKEQGLGQLLVLSKPGAQIQVDGKNAEGQRSLHELPQGAHQVLLRGEGVEPQLVNVHITPGALSVVTFD